MKFLTRSLVKDDINIVRTYHGEQREEAQELTRRIMRKFYSNNIFGNKFSGAIKNFQEDNNLIPDGIIGPQTINAMRRVEHFNNEEYQHHINKLKGIEPLMIELSRAEYDHLYMDGKIDDNIIYIIKDEDAISNFSCIVTDSLESLDIDNMIVGTMVYLEPKQKTYILMPDKTFEELYYKSPEIKESIPHHIPSNCPRCGAAVTGKVCEYCKGLIW